MYSRQSEARPLATRAPPTAISPATHVFSNRAATPSFRCRAIRCRRRPERLVLEQLHGARDDARVDGAAEDDGAGVEDQVEDEGTVVDGGVMSVALKAPLSLGRTLLALGECFGTDTLGVGRGWSSSPARRRRRL